MMVNVHDFIVIAPRVMLFLGPTVFVGMQGINLPGNVVRYVVDPRDTASPMS